MPKHSRTPTERSTPFSDTRLKFTAIFRRCNDFFLWQKYTKQQGSRCYQKAVLLKYIYYELRSINLYLEGAAFSASTICQYNITWETFLLKTIHKMWRRSYSQTLFWNTKIEQISGSIVQSFVQFTFIISQMYARWNVLKLSSRALAFTSYKAFLKTKKRSGWVNTNLVHYLFCVICNLSNFTRRNM